MIAGVIPGIFYYLYSMIEVEFFPYDGDSFIRNEFTMVITMHNHKIPIRKISKSLLDNYELLTKYISERIKDLAQWN